MAITFHTNKPQRCLATYEAIEILARLQAGTTRLLDNTQRSWRCIDFPLDRLKAQRWLALPLSVALGGLLVVVLFAGLRPRPAAAAALAEPATLYSCTEPGLNAGDDAGCPGVDQRGTPRPVGPHFDTPAPLDPALAGSGQVRVGAFEFGGRVPRLWLPLVRK